MGRLRKDVNPLSHLYPTQDVADPIPSAPASHLAWLAAAQVKPLRKQLTGLKAWITGQRKDQSPGTRMAVPVVQVDPVFTGVEGGPGSLVKYNPLSNMTSAEIWNFLRVMVSQPPGPESGAEGQRGVVTCCHGCRAC